MGGLCSCLGGRCLEEEEEIPSEIEHTPSKEVFCHRPLYHLSTDPLPPGEHPINWEKSSARVFAQRIKDCEPMISAVQKHADWIASLKGHLADRTSSGETSSVKEATGVQKRDFKKEVAGMFGVMSPEAAAALYWKNASLKSGTYSGVIPLLKNYHSVEKLTLFSLLWLESNPSVTFLLEMRFGQFGVIKMKSLVNTCGHPL
ncbi:uncharacterized protein LOC144581563 isoform X1 [Callithrix jacchus]